MTAPTDALRGLLNVLRDSQCLPDGDGVEATRIEVSFYALSDVLIAGHDAADRIESLLARIEAAEKALEDALGANNLAADPLERARFYAANPLREDSIVREICEHHGYGAVMDSASRQWLTKDGDGARGAFVVGTCYATWVRAREALRAAAQWQAGQEGEG